MSTIRPLSAFLSHAWGRRWWFFRDVTHDGREAVYGHLLASSG
jgi:hypothetical protein